MNTTLTEWEFSHLEERLKQYFEKSYQYKDGVLPEWKGTIVPGYHKYDKGHEVRTVYKIKDILPSSTGSDFGSYHWFSTLMARHLHMGEFLINKSPDEEILREWAKDLYNTSNEIIAWFKLFNKQNDGEKTKCCGRCIKGLDECINDINPVS